MRASSCCTKPRKKRFLGKTREEKVRHGPRNEERWSTSARRQRTRSRIRRRAPRAPSTTKDRQGPAQRPRLLRRGRECAISLRSPRIRMPVTTLGKPRPTAKRARAGMRARSPGPAACVRNRAATTGRRPARRERMRCRWKAGRFSRRSRAANDRSAPGPRGSQSQERGCAQRSRHVTGADGRMSAAIQRLRCTPRPMTAASSSAKGISDSRSWVGRSFGQ